MIKAESLEMTEIDPMWRQFLQQKVNSFVKWDLIRFFHDNPHTVDTSRNVAAVVGRDVDVVHQELDELVKANLLVAEWASGLKVYRLAEDRDLRQKIGEFMAACHNREFRVKAIRHVIRVGSDSARSM